MFISGLVHPASRVRVEWGRVHDGQVLALRRDAVPIQARAEAGAIVEWRFVTLAGPLRRPRGSTVLRTTLWSADATAPIVLVTAPVRYSRQPLTNLIARERVLALANVAPAFPCVNQPAQHDGLVDVPRLILTSPDEESPVRFPGTSPFSGLLDLYRLRPLPLALSEGAPENLVAFELDTLPGAVVVAPEHRLVVT